MHIGKIIKSYGFVLIILAIYIGNIHANPLKTAINPDNKIEFSAVDINGNYIDLSKKKDEVIVLLFFQPINTKHKGLMAYAQVVYNRYKGKGLSIIGITQEGESIGNSFKRAITFPLIVDTDKKIHNAFDISGCCGGTIVFNKNGKIKFKSPSLVNQESLRQLVELEITGKISYDFPVTNRQSLFLKNKKAPNIQLKEAYSSKVKKFSSFNEKNLVVTFFSSVCSMCKSGRRINDLISIKDTFKHENNRIKFLLVFFRPYDEKDIEEWEKHIKMPFEKYISNDIFSDDEKYVTDDSLKTDPLTIILNSDRKVVFLENSGMTEEQFSKEILKSIE